MVGIEAQVLEAGAVRDHRNPAIVEPAIFAGDIRHVVERELQRGVLLGGNTAVRP